jgi:hypothetical protein
MDDVLFWLTMAFLAVAVYFSVRSTRDSNKIIRLLRPKD